MNILVLGGNGYLGSQIIFELIKNSENHIVCTKRSTSNTSRIDALIESQRIKTIPATIDAIEAVLQYTSFDIVLNMACSYGRKSALYHNVVEANIDFPLKILNAVAQHGTTTFLTIGTGLPDELNMYTFSKSMFGAFGKYYAKNHGINFYNLKLEMFYGYDEPKNRFIPRLIKKMLAGEDVDVTVGTQKRDIIAVKDIISAIVMVIDSGLTGYHEISVGTGIAPTIQELVTYIWEQTGCRSTIHWGAVPMRENEPDCVSDITKLKELGLWEPVFWKTGISEMITKMREEL